MAWSASVQSQGLQWTYAMPAQLGLASFGVQPPHL